MKTLLTPTATLIFLLNHLGLLIDPTLSFQFVPNTNFYSSHSNYIYYSSTRERCRFNSPYNVVTGSHTPLYFSKSLQDANSDTSPHTITTATSTLLQKKEILSLQLEAEKLAYSNHDTYAMNALFVNTKENPTPRACSINSMSTSSSLPLDLPHGCLLRIGPNGATEEDGFLDGDGMIHSITIPPPNQNNNLPMYSSTYVHTNGRNLEKQSKEQGSNHKFRGTLGSAPNGWPMLFNLVQNALEFKTIACQKDTCNTAMAQSGDRILALMEQSRPSEITVGKTGRIKTVDSMMTLDGAIENAPITGGNFGAHGRTCPYTKERIHVTYNSNSRPFVKVDIFEENWKLKSSIGVDVPTPIMVHDCAITTNYVTIFDFPLTVRPKRFLTNEFPVEYEPQNGARIGLTKRNTSCHGGKGGDEITTKWFDVEEGVVLHLANAYENDDGHVVIHGAKAIPKSDGSYILEYSPSFLHEWILDPKSNKVLVDRCLNPKEIVEFPAIEEGLTSKQCNYCYTLQTTGIGSPLKQFKTPRIGVLLDGLLKFSLLNDVENGSMAGDVIGRFMLPEGWHFVSEPTVVSKTGNIDEHYILAIATEVPMGGRDVDIVELALEKNAMRSQFIILDGNDISRGPVSTFDLPSHVNYGLHSLFVPWESMN